MTRGWLCMGSDGGVLRQTSGGGGAGEGFFELIVVEGIVRTCWRSVAGCIPLPRKFGLVLLETWTGWHTGV